MTTRHFEYEYHVGPVAHFDPDLDRAPLLIWLNDLGDDGWELVHLDFFYLDSGKWYRGDTAHWCGTFKRERPE